MPFPAPVRCLLLTLLGTALALCPAARAADPATALEPPPLEWQVPRPLEPFTGTYAALYRGKPAGEATLSLKRRPDGRWEMRMDVRGNRGVAGVLGLNLTQTTVFEVLADGRYRPLTQQTVRRGLFIGKSVSGRYDWERGLALWEGDIDRKRRAPVPLQPGDLSALLINLAVMRDAAPGARLSYRFADAGRSRQYHYQAADAPALVSVQDLSYSALHLWRTNVRDGDATEFWIAAGIPTPIRIAQQEDGKPGIDLQLVQYEGG